MQWFHEDWVSLISDDRPAKHTTVVDCNAKIKDNILVLTRSSAL